MKCTNVLFWSVLSGIAGLGFYAFVKAINLFLSATFLLIPEAHRNDYYLMTGLWFVGSLICGVSVIWLLRRFCDHKGRFVTDDEETS